MTSNRSCLLALALLAATSGAAWSTPETAATSQTPPAPAPIYLGTDAGDSPDDVVVLFVNFRPAKNGTAKCRVAIIAQGSTYASKEIGVPAIIVTTPGRHNFGAHLTGLREGMIRDEHVFEAGRKYRVDCAGRSKLTVKIEAEEV